MKFKKILAAVLVLVMIMSGFTACSSSKKSTNTISADSTWFDSNEVTLASQYNTNDYGYVYSQYLGMDDEGVVLLTNATLVIPEYLTDYNYSDYDKYYVDYYSFEGELVSSVCINPAMAELNNDYGFMSGASFSDGVVSINYDVYSETALEPDTYTVDVDYVNGVLGDLEHSASGSGSDEDMYARYPEFNYEGAMETTDYVVHKYWISDDNQYSYILVICEPDGEEVTLDLRNEFPDLSVFDISNASKINENSILIFASIDGAGSGYFIYNISDNTITDVSEEYSWLENVDTWNMTSYDGVGTLVVDPQEGIILIDFENQTTEPFISFDECNVNRNTFSNMSIINATNDSVTLAGSVYTNNSDNDVYKMITLNRAESNPNAGKTILKAASMDGYSEYVYESIYRFNNASETCFMVLDDRYSIYDAMADVEFTTWEEYESTALNTYATLGDQLTVDIIAGEGPDILFNATDLTQLNNPNYLVDLNGLVNGESYFTNIFEACLTDGALYQMPLTINTVGITTTAEYVAAGQVGFTFEEYLTFVDEVCNGTDPISLTKSEYFSVLHAAMNDLFRDGNTVNYNCDAFRALAAYIKDDVIEPDYGDDYYVDDWGWENYTNPVATYGGLGSISSFFSTYGDHVEDVRFLGVPSYDGRGPQFTIESSVAVSAQAASIEGCEEFVSILLDEDMQRAMSSGGWSTPVNRDVLISVGEEAVADHNNNVDLYLQWYTPDELQMYGLSTTRLTNSAIDYYVDIIEGCTTCATVDVAVDLIIREEMEAYYAGQKDIDTVVDTMSNRITTYLNERG